MPRREIENKEVEWVSARIIRQEFNNRQIYKKLLIGEIVETCPKSNHLSDPKAVGEPYCTHNQMVFYYTLEGEPVAIVHQYYRQDGTIGGSGLPDPKKIFLEDKIMAYRERRSG